jgi:hypothetical protein
MMSILSITDRGVGTQGAPLLLVDTSDIRNTMIRKNTTEMRICIPPSFA